MRKVAARALAAYGALFETAYLLEFGEARGLGGGHDIYSVGQMGVCQSYGVKMKMKMKTKKQFCIFSHEGCPDRSPKYSRMITVRLPVQL